ncbi:hypothetical protein ASZ90_014512 [hydrocarbon metagenome]|uniref:Uncharacterized protein n=1 Tax=hydrocarbon metagenome TaxID=938273 RepID=A0A0W8F4K1_9ZZZZ
MMRTAAENISKTRKTMEHCGSTEVPQPDSHGFSHQKFWREPDTGRFRPVPG